MYRTKQELAVYHITMFHHQVDLVVRVAGNIVYKQFPWSGKALSGVTCKIVILNIFLFVSTS